jgi:RimJ/RimL family protein N-acetyltransferase
LDALHSHTPGAPVLEGARVRLEPLARSHLDALVAAAGDSRESFPWSAVPLGVREMSEYVDTALAWQQAGTALPFATVRIADGSVIGSTRFFLIERWSWPVGHREAARSGADGCEIGYTWLAPAARRTAANSEAKLLMLTHAFESWGVQRVCLHTDVRNQRSREALARLGAKFEGVLRAHRLASDLTARDSARYSIIAAEWPQLKQRLQQRLCAPRG